MCVTEVHVPALFSSICTVQPQTSGDRSRSSGFRPELRRRDHVGLCRGEGDPVLYPLFRGDGTRAMITHKPPVRNAHTAWVFVLQADGPLNGFLLHIPCVETK